MLLPPIAFAQREASVDPARRQPRYYSSRRHSPRTRQNDWARPRVIVAGNRPKYVWATIVLTLSIFLITTTIIQSATSSVTVARSHSRYGVTCGSDFPCWSRFRQTSHGIARPRQSREGEGFTVISRFLYGISAVSPQIEVPNRAVDVNSWAR